MKKKLLTVLVMMMMVVFAACGQSGTNNAPQTGGNNNQGANAGDNTENEPVAEEEGGTIVLGTSADFAPFEFRMMIDGVDTIVGFDIDIAREIANDLGKELVIEDIDFDGLLMALNTDKVDFVISGMNPTPDRQENVDFSDIYYFGAQGVLVNEDVAEQYQTVEDLAGKTIGVQTGSIQEDIASEIEGASLTTLAKIPELILELQTGRVDAVIVDVPVAERYAESQAGIVVSDIEFELTEEEAGYAIAVKKGNTELLESINATLARLIENGDVERFVVEANALLNEME